MENIAFNYRHTDTGFTLIELSIVLVIIGLIVGGVLVGQNLITASAARATITQIEKYNTAANTFYGKYGYLPGDIPATPAAQFGFIARGQYRGEGDGNGVMEGVSADCSGPGCSMGLIGATGETAVFWVDLSAAHLIEGGFNTASTHTVPSGDITGTAIAGYIPQAKLGNGNSIYVYSSGTYTSQWNPSSANYFGLSAVYDISAYFGYGKYLSNVSIPVSQAYSIDAKIDDGLPQTGRVTAQYVNTDVFWTDGTDALYNSPSTAATPASSTTCYDNGGNAGKQSYSLSQNNGNGPNCALSFKMQAGD